MIDSHSRLLVEQKLKQPFVIGGNYSGVPITHDVLRGEQTIYNENIEQKTKLEGRSFEFIKVSRLPTNEEISSLEWRTVDLMNHLRYSNNSKIEQVESLVQALLHGSLDLSKLEKFINTFGNLDAQTMFALVLEYFLLIE